MEYSFIDLLVANKVYLVIIFICFVIATIWKSKITYDFNNANKQGVFEKMNHEARSFRQGIKFTYQAVSSILILSIFIEFAKYIFELDGSFEKAIIYKIRYISPEWSILLNSSLLFIYYCHITILGHAIYPVTEVKHIEEHKDNNEIKIFLIKYVTYAIVQLSIGIVITIYKRTFTLRGAIIITIIIIFLFLLGMTDILNNYEYARCSKKKKSLIRSYVNPSNIKKVITSKEYRTYSINQLKYNLKCLYKGLSIYIREIAQVLKKNSV